MTRVLPGSSVVKTGAPAELAVWLAEMSSASTPTRDKVLTQCLAPRFRPFRMVFMRGYLLLIVQFQPRRPDAFSSNPTKLFNYSCGKRTRNRTREGEILEGDVGGGVNEPPIRERESDGRP